MKTITIAFVLAAAVSTAAAEKKKPGVPAGAPRSWAVWCEKPSSRVCTLLRDGYRVTDVERGKDFAPRDVDPDTDLPRNCPPRAAPDLRLPTRRWDHDKKKWVSGTCLHRRFGAPTS